MKRALLVGVVAALTSPLAMADTGGSTANAQPDLATRTELHRQRLATEFQLLNAARTTTFGSDFGVEGRLFTLRFALFNTSQETPLANAVGRSVAGVTSRSPLANKLGMAGPGIDPAQVDAVTAGLPPFRLTFGDEGKTFNVQLGAIEGSLGQGALVSRYLNNPKGTFNFNSFGVVLSAQARSLGGTIMTGSILDPARFVGFNVKGRPLQWIWGTYNNFTPEQWGNFDPYALLLSALTLGITGAIDTSAPSTVLNHAVSGDVTRPPPVPGTAGGLSGEADVGINHDVLDAHIYGNATMLGRTFNEAALGPDGRMNQGAVTNLWGAGASAGVRFNIFLELLKFGGSFEYRLAGPNYTPSYFNRYYEADRVYGFNGGGPKLTQRSVARHGYNLELGAQLMKTFGVFMELGDLVPLDYRLGQNDATLRVGGMLHVLGMMSFMGAYVNRGFQNYLTSFEGNTGSMWLGEARLNLMFLHLVARQWRSFDRAPSTGKLYPLDGQSVLAEIVIGIL